MFNMYSVYNKDVSLVKSFATWSIGLTYYTVMVTGQLINAKHLTYQNSNDGSEFVEPLLINQPGLLLLPWIRLT